MAIVNLYSKRKKAIERITQPEVYQYTDLPIPFRRQIIYIWERAIGLYNGQISSLARNVCISIYGEHLTNAMSITTYWWHMRRWKRSKVKKRDDIRRKQGFERPPKNSSHTTE